MITSSSSSPPEWNVSPVWVPHDNQYVPIDWSSICFSKKTRQILEFLQTHPIEHAQVFIRGGLLEQKRPHPQSDLDVTILIDTNSGVDYDWNELDRFGHPLDVKVISPRDITSVQSLLIHTRSLQVSGEPFQQRPFTITDRLWQDLWYLYGVSNLPSRLTSRGYLRVVAVKQIFRSVAILHAMDTNEFTRDLYIALGWSKEYSIELYHRLEEIYISLHRGDYKEFDIGSIQKWLKKQYHRRI